MKSLLVLPLILLSSTALAANSQLPSLSWGNNSVGGITQYSGNRVAINGGANADALLTINGNSNFIYNLFMTDEVGNPTLTVERTTGRIDAKAYSSTGATQGPPIVVSYFNSSPTDGDTLGHFAWRGYNSALTEETYGFIHTFAIDVSANSMDSQMRFGVMKNLDGTNLSNNQPNLFTTYDGTNGWVLPNVPLAGAATVGINGGATGQQAILIFYDLSTAKWQFGKQTDNSLVGYDYVNNKNFMTGSTAGDFSLGETGRTLTLTGASVTLAGNPLNNVSALQLTGGGAGRQSVIEYTDDGIAKFQMGKQTDNTWIMYDYTNAANLWTIDTSGNMVFGESGKTLQFQGTNVYTSNLAFLSSTPTVAAGQVAFGNTHTATSSCGSLAGAMGCLKINVEGNDRYIPYY